MRNPTPGESFFPCTAWHPIGDGIQWRPYRHRGMNCWAGEGRLTYRGDGSGCLFFARRIGVALPPYAPEYLCRQPSIVQARIYRLASEPSRKISAVLSYPIGAEGNYFWETYDYTDCEPDRFRGEKAEQHMEDHVRALLLAPLEHE